LNIAAAVGVVVAYHETLFVPCYPTVG